MGTRYTLLARCGDREIEWDYGHLKHAAWRAFRAIRSTGRLHDTGEAADFVHLLRGDRSLDHVEADDLALARLRCSPLHERAAA